MDTGKKAYFEHLSADEYDALLPERLQAEAVSDDQLLTLLVREHNETPDAYRLEVAVTEVKQRMASVAFKILVLDADLQPVSKPIDSSIDSDNMWSGDLCIESATRIFFVPHGFFVPYEDTIDWSDLEAVVPVGVSR